MVPLADQRTLSRDLVVLSLGFAATAAVAALLRAVPGTSPTTVALALLLVVLAAATRSRLWVSVVVSTVAMLVLNFFFIPPIGTFTVADPQNWVALFTFLIVAVITGNLSTAAQARARDAVARRNEVTRLFDLSRDVLLTSENAGALDALARHIARRFELGKVAIYLPSDHGWRVYQGAEDAVIVDEHQLDKTLASARGTLEFDARQRAYGGHARGTDTSGEPVSLVPLRHGMRAIGVLAVGAPLVDMGALDAVAGVAAIAIERVQFLADRDAAELVRQKADLASTLLATLSHDLRTPLTAIRVAVENLQRDLPVEARREQATAALSELNRLTRLFQDILDMARIDASAIRIDRQWITPADIVDAAAAHVRHELEGRTLRVDADADTEVEIDPKLTSAALAHLIENAAQYSPADRPITVTAEVEANGLRVSVQDAGPGLDPGEVDHLFERFYRGRAARLSSFGTGMGLAITRGLLAAAGGRVWAEIVAGSGARFTIVVPGATRATPPVEADLPPSAEASVDRRSARGGGQVGLE
jgi:two-component system, OmpR family, sensor histidine kinase KdpD